MNSLLIALLGVSLVLLLSACSGAWRPGAHHDAMHGGRDSRADAVVEATGAAAVTIEDSSFRPGNLRVSAGTTVTWTNRDGVAHTATARDGGWDTGLLGRRDSATVTFDEPGVYEYYCMPHPTMRARIEVVG